MAASFLQMTDKEFLLWSGNVATLTTATPAVFGASVAQAALFSTAQATFSAAMAALSNPNTQTPVWVAAKNTARKALLAQAKAVVAIADTTITVTPAQRAQLGIPPKLAPTPVPQPGTSPIISIVSMLGLVVKLQLVDSVSKKKTKPPGVVNAIIFSYVGPTPPADMSNWKYQGIATKPIVNVNFPIGTPAGSLVWFAAFWSNAKGESGIPSQPVSANIPGGGVSMAA